jgi:hypothetical protein
MLTEKYLKIVDRLFALKGLKTIFKRTMVLRYQSGVKNSLTAFYERIRSIFQDVTEHRFVAFLKYFIFV